MLPPLTAPPEPVTDRPRRSRVRTLAWSLAVGAVGLGLGAPRTLDWWQDAHPAAAAGDCGGHPPDAEVPRAVLLNHSDALNKKNVA